MTTTNNSVFRSTDTDAVNGVRGRCSGTAGDGVALLDMLLVNGYNWQELTPANLTQTSNVATIAQAAHGFNIDQRAWVIGMDQAGYMNGATYGDATYFATVADSSHATFPTTGSPTSPATAAGSTTLGAAIVSTTATSITLTSGSSFPAFPYIIKIDSEWMLVTAGFQTTTPTVVRGFGNSTAATHTNTTAVAQKILMGVAPAGGFTHWTKDFTTTNKSTYRAPGGNQMYADVDDTNTLYILVRGYQAMSGTATGTDPFPTTTQVAAGSTGFGKSNVATTAARNWICTATDRSINLIIDCPAGGALQNAQGAFIFSDLVDLTHTSDAYATMLIADMQITGAGTSGVMSAQAIAAVQVGHYMCRSYTQLSTSIQCNKYSLDARNGAATTIMGGGGLSFPHNPDGGLYLGKVGVNEGSVSNNRGTLPGIYNILHLKPANHLDTWTGTGSVFGGRKFIAVNVYNGGQLALEISHTISAT